MYIVKPFDFFIISRAAKYLSMRPNKVHLYTGHTEPNDGILGKTIIRKSARYIFLYAPPSNQNGPSGRILTRAFWKKLIFQFLAYYSRPNKRTDGNKRTERKNGNK